MAALAQDQPEGDRRTGDRAGEAAQRGAAHRRGALEIAVELAGDPGAGQGEQARAAQGTHQGAPQGEQEFDQPRTPRTYSVRPEPAGQNMPAATNIARARISPLMEPRKQANGASDDRAG